MDEHNLIQNWLSDRLNEEEMNQFKAREDYQIDQDIIDGAKQFKAAHFSEVSAVPEIIGTSMTKGESKVRRLKTFQYLSGIAAALIVGLGLYFAFFNSPLTNVQTLASEQTEFTLPDASKVSLNSLSSIVYNKKNWSNERSLDLNGEAYFEVAKGSKFDVETKVGIVRVLGTKFTVKQRDNYFEVQCFEGIVGVVTKNSKQTLTKGMVFRIINNQSTLDSIQTALPDWKQHRSTFKSIPLNLVLDELERQFGVQIEVNNIDINRLFTGGFDHTNIDTALESVTSPFNLTYKKQGETKYHIE